MTALGTPPIRERLLAELGRCDEVVLLGDLLSLRDGAVTDVLRAAEPFLAGLREAAAGKRVIVVPGNHDHGLARSVLDAVHRKDLGLEQVAKPAKGGIAGAVARKLKGLDLAIAYPGLWIRPDVYATHGHYLDCHTTVPRLDPLLASLAAAALERLPARRATPGDYEAVLAPVYAVAYEYAQSRAALKNAPDGPPIALWRALQDFGWRRMSRGPGDGVGSRALLGLAVSGALGLMKLSGLGAFSLDLSLGTTARAGVAAATEVVERLGIAARHVVFGHTHRAGPLEGEAAWGPPQGPALVNAGSWVWPGLRGDESAVGGYRPGRWVLVRDSGPPELRSVLEEPAAAFAAA
jgi:hypothetical protein